jgi:hypothetical protein
MNNLSKNQKPPAISCKCITYGRVNLLEESIESFLRQNYEGKKELIIINDYPLQKLYYDHPEIKIINVSETFETIGHKENFAVNHCNYNIIAVWDDDDIAMPNHLSNIAKYFQSDTDLLHWGRGIFFNEPNNLEITSLGNSGIVYSKSIWKKLGGHCLENAGYDMSFVVKIKQVSDKIIIANPPDNEVSWFYMWGDRCYHMSGQGADTSGKPSALKRHSDFIEKLRKDGKIPTGDIQLRPHWDKDYIGLLNDLNKNKKRVLVTTAAFGSNLSSLWVPQQSNKYDIVYNRITESNQSSRFKALHPRLRAKIPKMAVWEDNPDYDYYIWLDSWVSIRSPNIVEKFVNECQDVDACFFKHCARSSVEQELDFCLTLMNDGNEYLLSRYQGENMKEQVIHYYRDKSWIDNNLFECCIFIYNKRVIENTNYNLMKEWLYHNLIWSVQDQLSLPYLLHKFKTNYKILNGTAYKNEWF